MSIFDSARDENAMPLVARALCCRADKSSLEGLVSLSYRGLPIQVIWPTPGFSLII